MSSRMKMYILRQIILLSLYVLVDSYTRHLRSLPPLKVDEFTGTLKPLDDEIHQTELSFGKHKGETYKNLYEKHHNYWGYVLEECEEKKWNNRVEFHRLGEYILDMWRREYIEVTINEQSNKKKARACHAVGSGKDILPSPYDSWKDCYEMFVGVDFTELNCSTQTWPEKEYKSNGSFEWISVPCTNKAVLGGHVFVEGNDLYPAIVPMCIACNNKRDWDLGEGQKYKFLLRHGTMMLMLYDLDIEESNMHEVRKTEWNGEEYYRRKRR